MDLLSNDNYDNLLKMASISVPTKIAKTVSMAEQGQLSKENISKIFAFLASERYPGDRLALSKFMADDDGAHLNNVLVRAELAAKRGESREPFAMASDNPANDQEAASTPEIEDGDEDTTSNARTEFATGSKEKDPSELRNKFARYCKEMISAHASQNGISHHHAIDDLLKTSPYFRQLLNASKLSA